MRERGRDRLIRIQKQDQPKSSTPVFIIREYEGILCDRLFLPNSTSDF